MFPMMTDTPLTPAQISAAIRLMLHIAHVDGAKTAEEVALIRGFYDDCRAAGTDLPAFETLAAGHDVAAADMADAGQRDLLVALCFMVAYADGELSDAERRAIGAVATRLEVGEVRGEAILAQVKDTMLASLSRLPDAESVAAVARELG